jgi:predicted TIM-barrel fold metal-dependent hydrolase
MPPQQRRAFVDAHIHVWPELGEQSKPSRYTADDHFAVSRPAGVVRTVLIQPGQFRFDNSYMLAAVRAHPGVFSAVAVVDADQPAAQLDALAAQLRQQGVRGFRVTGEKAANALCRMAAKNRMAICPLINPDALAWVGAMCEKHRDVTVVIDHLARIGATGQIADADVRALCGLAKHRRVHVKVSAFYALSRKAAPYTDLEPLIRQVFETYGPRRLMWGSDAPYQAQAPHSYQASVDLVGQLRFLTADDRDWLLRRTAERVFF